MSYSQPSDPYSWFPKIRPWSIADRVTAVLFYDSYFILLVEKVTESELTRFRPPNKDSVQAWTPDLFSDALNTVCHRSHMEVELPMLGISDVWLQSSADSFHQQFWTMVTSFHNQVKLIII